MPYYYEPPVEPIRPPGRVPVQPPLPPGSTPPAVNPVPPARPPRPPTPPPVPPSQPAPRRRGLPSTGQAPQAWPGWGIAPSWWVGWQPGAGQLNATNMAAFVHNMLLPWLDPNSQAEYARWLARQNPAVFGAGGYGPLSPNAPGQQLATPAWNLPWQAYQNRLRDLLSTGAAGTSTVGQQRTNPFNFEQMLRYYFGTNTPTETQRQEFMRAWAPVNWLADYVRTALGGMSDSWRQQSRAARANALTRLETLAREASGSEILQPYLALGEALVNPVMTGRRLSGGVGMSRAVSMPFGEAIRGSYRNPWAT